MWKKCSIVMLPANQKGFHFHQLMIARGALMLAPEEDMENVYNITGVPQHLYILSDEEIKQDKWFKANQGIHKCLEVVNGNYLYKIVNRYHKDNEIQYMFHTWKNNVIASTESLLELPSIPQSFISLYIDLYNQGNAPVDVEVEYDEEPTIDGNANKYAELKIDSNNCISIKRNKKDLNNTDLKEKLELLISNNEDDFDRGKGKYILKQWISENL